MQKITYYSFTLVLLTPLANLGTDIYTPSLPNLVCILHTTPQLLKLSITLYLIFYGIGQLIFGVASDYIGRRAILLLGVLIFALSSAIIGITENIYVLLCLRMMQGVGAAIISVITKVMMSDSFEGEQLSEMANNKVTLQIASMVFAPLIGAIIQQFYGWHWNFIFLFIYAVIGFALSFYFIPETRKNQISFDLISFRRTTLSIIVNKNFIIVTVVTTIIYSIVVIVGVLGSFYIQSVLHYTAFTYGIITLLMGICYILGSIFNKFYRQKRYFNPPLMLFISSVCFILLALLNSRNIYFFILPVAFILFFSGYLLSSIMAFALNIFKHYAGIANALFGTFVMIGTGIVVSIFSLFNLNNGLIIPFTYFILSSICLFICQFI